MQLYNIQPVQVLSTMHLTALNMCIDCPGEALKTSCVVVLWTK